jgi:ComF family protein
MPAPMPVRPGPWTRHLPQSLPRSVPRALLRLLLPSACALCGAGCDGVVCAPCRDHFCLPVTHRCGRCANPLPALVVPGTAGNDFPRRRESILSLHHDSTICGSCLSTPPAYDATIVAVDYTPPLDQLVLQLKFSARLPLAPWFADMLRDAVLARPGLPLPDLLCPVPLGASRLVERGFNQALEIARPLAGALGVRLAPRLAVRQLETRAQSGVSPHERADNIRGAFGVEDPDLVAGRHVGLVDDVMTSGHTLDELAATFKRFGAARVTNLVFARTPPHRPPL